MSEQQSETPTTGPKKSKKTQTSSEPRLKKINTEIVKMEVGDKVQGFFVGKNTGPWTDKKTGEVKELTRVFFEREKGGDKFLLFEDAGLRNAFSNSMVNQGDHILIEKLDLVDLGGGRSSNQYDIYQVLDS